MSGSITFVGAGPGAPDLITLRGAAALRDADLVIYAGSLVNEELLELASKARLVNSAKLALPEVLREMRQAYEQGENVVRLHTGDPAIYGAVSEQFRELDRLGIPYRKLVVGGGDHPSGWSQVTDRIFDFFDSCLTK